MARGRKSGTGAHLRLADTLEGVALQTLAPMLDRDQAMLAAEHIASEFLGRCHGQQVYIHSRAVLDRRRRDQYIADHYSGTAASARWLAEMFDIHEIHVYRIVARMRGKQRSDRRPANPH